MTSHQSLLTWSNFKRWQLYLCSQMISINQQLDWKSLHDILLINYIVLKYLVWFTSSTALSLNIDPWIENKFEEINVLQTQGILISIIIISFSCFQTCFWILGHIPITVFFFFWEIMESTSPIIFFRSTFTNWWKVIHTHVL